jgi:hypothetical protein
MPRAPSYTALNATSPQSNPSLTPILNTQRQTQEDEANSGEEPSEEGTDFSAPRSMPQVSPQDPQMDVELCPSPYQRNLVPTSQRHQSPRTFYYLCSPLPQKDPPLVSSMPCATTEPFPSLTHALRSSLLTLTRH